MDTANYLCNRLPTKGTRGELILEEHWTEKKQDVGHIKVFGSTVSVVIPKKSGISRIYTRTGRAFSLDIVKIPRNTYERGHQRPSKFLLSATLTLMNRSKELSCSSITHLIWVGNKQHLNEKHPLGSLDHEDNLEKSWQQC